MNKVLKNSIRFVLFLLIQIIILNEIPPLHQYITPYLYFIFILWLPFGTNRLTLTILGFLLGYCLDLFTNTPGLHTAAGTLIGYIRPSILNLLLAQETSEEITKEPSVGSMGWVPYFIYVIIITFVHHFYLIVVRLIQIFRHRLLNEIHALVFFVSYTSLSNLFLPYQMYRLFLLSFH